MHLQLGRVAKRVHESHRIPFTYDDAVVKLIAGRCTELESAQITRLESLTRS